ncbi:scavenger receptor cysteine-rich domain superfamily protein-like [Lytechinus pictus]|uniref:scavenger receptor cysteine-rich domain superfamily protein-like n=1 Tax=Lytechinus pictus TaxID=7653 RepID=UPI0030BA1721
MDNGTLSGFAVEYKDDLQVRLVNGGSDKEGRVEILYLGAWGTVCDDNWDLNDANVVCRMLGFERAENYSCCSAFGPGTGPILLDEVECEGTESNIGHCRRSDYETHDCDHSEDVGISCIAFDINECQQTGEQYPCDALNGGCTNTKGSYFCTCASGYRLNIDDTCQEVIQASSSTMTMKSTDILPPSKQTGLSKAATYGLFGFLIVLVFCILLVCIIVTLRMQKYRRSAKESSRSQMADKNSDTATQNCYNGPQFDGEAYLELDTVPGSRTQGGSSSNQDGLYETPQPVVNDDKTYENIRI